MKKFLTRFSEALKFSFRAFHCGWTCQSQQAWLVYRIRPGASGRRVKPFHQRLQRALERFTADSNMDLQHNRAAEEIAELQRLFTR